jgi:alpha-beta hydrolase superfamily lysophospholipase
MATVICVDGLGGHPETTFRELKVALESVGNRVIILDTTRVVTHEDRVKMIENEYAKQLNSSEQIFLVGQSAGGSAVRILAERLNRSGLHLSGVVLLSPAMPFGIYFMTAKLFLVMLVRFIQLLLGRTISMTDSEFEMLTSPIAEEMRDVISKRQMVSGVEGRKLAFFPPKFVGYSYPTLQIFGREDKWIAPRAQRKLGKMLRKHGEVTTFETDGAGHLTLASSEWQMVAQLIQRWISLTSG